MCHSMKPPPQVEDKGEVRWVSLNRPDTHNAFNEHVIAEITDTFRTINHEALVASPKVSGYFSRMPK